MFNSNRRLQQIQQLSKQGQTRETHTVDDTEVLGGDFQWSADDTDLLTQYRIIYSTEAASIDIIPPPYLVVEMKV